MKRRRGLGLRPDELEELRSLRIDAELEGADLEGRQEDLTAWLDIELRGSSSLNSRGTTLAVLVGATIALVANFAATWLDPRWELSGGTSGLLVGLLTLSLVCLGLSALFALRAVWPFSGWRPQLSEIVPILAGDPEFLDKRARPNRYAQLLLETLEHQRAKNEQTARRMRGSLALLAAGIVLVLTQAVVFAVAADGAPSSCEQCGGGQVAAPQGGGGQAGQAGLPGDVGQQAGPVHPLAHRFAPVVWIHGSERFGPAPVDEFLARSELTWRTPGRFRRDKDLAPRGMVAPARLGSDCTQHPSDCYREGPYVATDFTRPHDRNRFRSGDLDDDEGFYLDPDKDARWGETGRAPRAPIYYEITKGKMTRIIYWFFFPFSRPNFSVGDFNLAAPFSHEGDWENIEVILERDGSPKAVRFFGHGDPHAFKWAEVCKYVASEEDCDSASSGRPVVYTALFSHASYASAAESRTQDTKVCSKKRLKKLCGHDLRSRGYLWDPLAGDGLRDAAAQPWYGFGGAWGGAGLAADTTGPLGPSRYKIPAEPEPGELEPARPESPPVEGA